MQRLTSVAILPRCAPEAKNAETSESVLFGYTTRTRLKSSAPPKPGRALPLFREVHKLQECSPASRRMRRTRSFWQDRRFDACPEAKLPRPRKQCEREPQSLTGKWLRYARDSQK